MTFFALTINLTIALVLGSKKLDIRVFKDIVNFFMIGVTIVVMAVPEGLPLAGY
jgi:magnesium-transporting ATPase (P-type)